MDILLVVGARPNFMKVAPVIRAIKKHNQVQGADLINYTLLHTGQHYDKNMSGDFFEVLDIPKPDINLGIGSGTHGEQTGKTLIEIEKHLLVTKYNIIVIFGDINPTVSAALAAAKLHMPVAHVEAGLRSWDRSMPEELNRIVTDHLSDHLFCTTWLAANNLAREGFDMRNVYVVGDTMLDTMGQMQDKIDESDVVKRFCLRKGKYAVLTLHRPSNVDDPIVFRNIMDSINTLVPSTKVVFPCHPRAKIKMREANIEVKEGVLLIDPLCYVDFLALVKDAQIVITDSGSLQTETTALGVPCVTLRENTERPETVAEGTNILAGNKDILPAIKKMRFKTFKRMHVTSSAAEKIVKILAEQI